MSKTIEVSDETFEKIKEQLGPDFQPKELDSLQDLVGMKLFIRTITYHHTGEVVKVSGNIVQLKNAAWIAYSARFADTLKNGELDEVEPTGDAYINWDSVVDFFPWKHDLPREQK